MGSMPRESNHDCVTCDYYWRVFVYKYYDKVRLTKKNSTDDKEVN